MRKILHFLVLLVMIWCAGEVYASPSEDNILNCKKAFAACDFKTQSCEIIKRCAAAAEQGHLLSQYSLGLSYKMGVDGSKNLKKAVFWIKKAAEQGEGVAQLHYGLMLGKGEGVEQNNVEALHWISRAHRKDIDKAEQAMYEIYTNGLKALANNPAAGVKFLQISTVIPFPKAQYDMAKIDLHVFASSKDEFLRHKAIINAYKWIIIANSDSIVPGKWNKPQEWKSAEADIKNKMTAAQIDEANKHINKFFAVQTEVYNKIEKSQGTCTRS